MTLTKKKIKRKLSYLNPATLIRRLEKANYLKAKKRIDQINWIELDPKSLKKIIDDGV